MGNDWIETLKQPPPAAPTPPGGVNGFIKSTTDSYRIDFDLIRLNNPKVTSSWKIHPSEDQLNPRIESGIKSTPPPPPDTHTHSTPKSIQLNWITFQRSNERFDGFEQDRVKRVRNPTLHLSNFFAATVSNDPSFISRSLSGRHDRMGSGGIGQDHLKWN